MAKIVISYRRSDSDVFAGRLRDKIADRYGADAVFMDIDNIPFGRDFRQHIQDALSTSKALVVVIGPQWLGVTATGQARIDDKNDPVRVEVETALKNSLPIIPVLVGDTKMPEPQQLPDDLKTLAFINAASVDTGRDFHPHMERVLRELDGILIRSRERWHERVRATLSGLSRGRRLSLGLGAIGAVAVAAVAIGAAAFGPSVDDAADVGMVKPPAGLSFDCQKPKSTVERTICRDPKLSTRDRTLNELVAFLKQREPAGAKPSLAETQRRWLGVLSRCNGANMIVCINAAYDARIASLRTGPSFECSVRLKLTERAICENPLLAAKDAAFADLYTRFKSNPSTTRAEAAAAQMQRLQAREKCVEPNLVNCLSVAYDFQILELERLLALKSAGQPGTSVAR